MLMTNKQKLTILIFMCSVALVSSGAAQFASSNLLKYYLTRENLSNIPLSENGCIIASIGNDKWQSASKYFTYSTYASTVVVIIVAVFGAYFLIERLSEKSDNEV